MSTNAMDSVHANAPLQQDTPQQLYIFRQESLEDLLLEGLCNEKQKDIVPCNILSDINQSLREMNDIKTNENKIVKKRTRRVFKKHVSTIESLQQLEEFVALKWKLQIKS
jgi:hypothetical protein